MAAARPGVAHGHHHSLNSKLEAPTEYPDHFVAATNLLLAVQTTMDKSSFEEHFRLLAQTLGTNDMDIESASQSMSTISMYRSFSPYKRKATDYNGMSSQAEFRKRTEADAKQRRDATEAFANEREEAGKGLETGSEDLYGNGN